MSTPDGSTAPADPTANFKSPKSIQRAKSTIQSLAQIVGPLPDHLSSSPDPAFALLHDRSVASAVSRHLRQPNSGAGDDNLCRWFYDTFQTTDSSLQLVVLRFLPIIAGLYLSRCTAHRHYQPLAGFEAVLLALYAHETVAREGNPMVVNLPNLSAPSPYHEAKATSLKSNKNTEEPIATTAVISAVLEPHGTVRSTKRARIVSVALELYHTKISHMPVESKIEFCHFASSWAGNFTFSEKKKNEDCEEKGERIPIPWELFLPTIRIVGHCLLGQTGGGELLNVAAAAAAKGLYERAMHDMNAPAVLAARSLMRLGMMGPDTILEPKMASVYTDSSDSASDSTQIVAA